MKATRHRERGKRDAESVLAAPPTRPSSPATSHPESVPGGFSLVEVVIAIGIFAFVIVGIIGLFPAALRIRRESALDTRATMIAQQMMVGVDTALNFTNATGTVIPTGPTNGNPAVIYTNLTNVTRPVVVGYQARSAMPYYLYQSNPASSWTNAGAADPEIVSSAGSHSIDTLVRIAADTNNLTNLARITIEVRSPAALALSNSRVVTFTTFRPYP